MITHAPGRAAQSRRRHDYAGRNPARFFGRLLGMTAFRYQAVESGGDAGQGRDRGRGPQRRAAFARQRGLFPSTSNDALRRRQQPPKRRRRQPAKWEFRLGSGVKRKEITALTREMGALLGAAIPIPQALEGLGEEEENPALRRAVLRIADSVRKGAAFSARWRSIRNSFSNLYVSMVRVGEEARRRCPRSWPIWPTLLEHEDEVARRSHGGRGVSGFCARLRLCHGDGAADRGAAAALQHVAGDGQCLPLPTLILLRVSALHPSLLDPGSYWESPGSSPDCAGILRTPRGRGEVGRRQTETAGDWAGFSGGGFEPVCADAGHAGQKRRLTSAGLENCRKHHWQSRVGES